MRPTALLSPRLLQIVVGVFIALCVALPPAVAQSGAGQVQQHSSTSHNPKPHKPHKHDRSNPKPPKPPKDHDDDRSGSNLRRAEPGSEAGTPDQSTGEQVAGKLRSGTLAGMAGVPISVKSQHAVLSAFSADAASDGDSLLAALVSHGNGQAMKEASRLVERLGGLPGRPERLRPAVQAFNAYVNASSAEFLAGPPPEFVALQAALHPMAEAALLASEQP